MNDAVECFNTTEIAFCQELTSNEIRFITIVSRMQETGDAYRKDIADLLRVSCLTVSRIIKTLKDKGFLFVRRIGSTVWRYFFKGPYLDGVAYQPCEGTICTSKNIHTKEENNDMHVAYQQCEASRLVISGPESPLLASLKANDHVYGLKSKEPKLPKKSRMESAREAMSKKTVSEYNCHDLWLVFFDLWKSRWHGHVPSWTGKDYGLVKRLLGLYGPKVVVEYFTHVFTNWDDIAVRYRVNGYPTVGMLSAYSKSWLPEMEHGKVYRPDLAGGAAPTAEDKAWLEERGIEFTAPKDVEYITSEDGARHEREAYEFGKRIEHESALKDAADRTRMLKEDPAYAKQLLADISTSPYIAEKVRKLCDISPAFAAQLAEVRVQFSK